MGGGHSSSSSSSRALGYYLAGDKDTLFSSNKALAYYLVVIRAKRGRPQEWQQSPPRRARHLL